MSTRRRAREIALQVLYQLDLDPADPKKVLALHWENFQPSEQAREFCARLVDGVLQNGEEIDRLIEEAVQGMNSELSPFAGEPLPME